MKDIRANDLEGRLHGAVKVCFDVSEEGAASIFIVK
jgi:hypothetical protein